MTGKLRANFFALLAGCLAVTGFAPYHVWPAPLLSLSVLGLLWHGCPHGRNAGWIGWFWGLGFFGTGIHWIEISLHEFGGMPLPLAYALIFLFSAFLAFFPALVGRWSWRFHDRPTSRWLLVTPALWTLSEWVRSWFLSGFPWLSLGYAATPKGPLAGFTPVLGVFGASAATVLGAGLLTLALLSLRHHRSALASFLALGMLLASGLVLKRLPWVHPVGQPIAVNLLQGNIPQDMKFMAESRGLIMQRYNTLLFNSTGRLILLPESALPYLRQQMPEGYSESLETFGYENNSDILVGLFSEPEPGQYYNSVFSFGHSPMQAYHKVHLVPFGEFIPLSNLLSPLIHTVLNIPLDDQQRGNPAQPPLRVGGQWVGVDICYEDAFGDEIRQVLPQATLLANFTNDAWFGSSIGPEQHLQMAQTRALETGRPMLRVTNTGVTALIGAHGEILERAPRAEIFNLGGNISGYGGVTPFVLVGNYGILALCALALILSLRWRPLR
ncbi:apolipoprotein N-acyltransferase [Ferrovum sp.]|uniref:apolipoprotein N-acyltransferase n=1 Tax=Ferrovum sp. TaxID=2609467 RepID=UPI002638797E|nr:apolipoprotein N-acyltransferase [Ferrovum sp.]